MDDDDEFLYGNSEPAPKQPPTVPQPISLHQVQASNGLVAHLEDQAASVTESATPTEENAGEEERVQQQEEEEEEVDLEDDSEDDDIEFIMEPQSRSLDFRNQTGKPAASRVASTSVPSLPKAPAPSLTTEYTPMQRGGIPPTPAAHATPQHAPPPSRSTATPQPGPSQVSPDPSPQPHQALAAAHAVQQHQEPDDGIDTSTLPPATAPPSHPAIDPTVPGVLDGRSIFEVDMSAMADKPWRRPGSDISDWFNYGFDEISWETYCYRRRDMGELANVLKTNVINFAGMPEDQIANLPPEARQMVMTGTMAMMNGAAANPGMMGPGMMGMDMMMGMGMDMGMGGPMMPMQDGQGQAAGVVPVPTNGTPDVGVGVGPGMMMQDGFGNAPQGGGAGIMNMGMGADYSMQDQNPMGQQMYPSAPAMENTSSSGGPGGAASIHPNVATPVPTVPSGPAGPSRGTPVPFRGGRAPPTQPASAARGGRGAFMGRGRGRGMFGDGPPIPVRPASPLPPNVPTGPRNQNKYKDRDGNAPAVDGLDYGGGGGGGKDMGGRRTPSGEPEDRSSSRKRRSSPSLDDSRGSKRR